MSFLEAVEENCARCGAPVEFAGDDLCASCTDTLWAMVPMQPGASSTYGADLSWRPEEPKGWRRWLTRFGVGS